MGQNLKAVRERITSVVSTQQITKAMKMVSAAKLRRAQQAIVQLRPYSERLNKILKNIISDLGNDASTPYGADREVKSALLVVITSSRGLCGGFNANIIKAAIETIQTKYAPARAAGKLSILCIGKKGYDTFKRYKDCTIINSHVDLFKDLAYENVLMVAQEAMDGFTSKQYDHVTICYGRFKNAAMQFAEAEQFLPVVRLKEEMGKAKRKNADYIFEPDKDMLLEHLVPSILHTQFYKCVLDTLASEHGARMTAMDKATENANELLKALRLSYNKARQEAITNELSEIVGGAAALGS